jgi:hypothetical protein
MLKIVGEPEIDCISFPQICCIPMSTAIVRIYTAEGFVIAADGFSTEDPTGNAQKIFPTSTPSWTLAFCPSVCAAAMFENKDSKSTLRIDFASQCQIAADRMKTSHPQDLNDYARSFSRLFTECVREQMDQAQRNGVLSPEDFAEWVAARETTILHFSGYFYGIPSLSTVKIIFGQPEPLITLVPVSEINPKPVRGAFFGSKKIQDKLEAGQDRYWDKYRTPDLIKITIQNQGTIDDAVVAARSYIEACSDVKAPLIDSWCESIGGRIRIAKITPSGGFEWVER